MGENLSGTICFFGIKSLDLCMGHPYDYIQLHVSHLRVAHDDLKKIKKIKSLPFMPAATPASTPGTESSNTKPLLLSSF